MKEITEKELAERELEQRFSDHKLREVPSRSWLWKRPNGSVFSAKLTWTAGAFSLTGDCGRVVILNYSITGNLEESLEWLATSDLDYLLGKTGLEKSPKVKDCVNRFLGACRGKKSRALETFLERNSREQLCDEFSYLSHQMADLVDSDDWYVVGWDQSDYWVVGVARLMARAIISALKEEAPRLEASP